MLGPVTRQAAIREFEPTLDGGALEELRERLDRWRGTASPADGWSRGVPGRWLAQLIADWRTFDTAAFQARLNRLEHAHVDLEGQRIHFVRVPGGGADPLPLLLTNGWPGSFCEYLAVRWRRWIAIRHLAGDSATCFGTVRRPTCPRAAPDPPSF
jgi:hypothetical protein